MKKVNAYQAEDGKVFPTATECAEYEMKCQLQRILSSYFSGGDMAAFFNALIKFRVPITEALNSCEYKINGPSAKEN